MRLPALTRSEWLRLSAFGGAVAFLHLLGWGVFLWYARSSPALAGLGTLAYTFGLRHAFDADHIAAIDNTTRKFLQEEERPLGIGFFFSLGHSSVVLALTASLAAGAAAVQERIPSFRHWGGYVGAGVSGTFLWAIGILNALVLLDVVRVFRELRAGELDEERLERRLLERGSRTGSARAGSSTRWACSSASASTPRRRSGSSRSPRAWRRSTCRFSPSCPCRCSSLPGCR
jgi:high-affinity nickel-transport protein